MAATLITAPELHEETEEVIRSKLLEYVPRFRQHMDRGAGDLIGDLESIIEHRLWARVGYDSMEAYANEHLQHSEEWCHEVIRIYRHDWSLEQRRKRTHGGKRDGAGQPSVADTPPLYGGAYGHQACLEALAATPAHPRSNHDEP